jgi:hypothetical protein
MNWKLILLLSMFGLATALSTVFFIPPGAEPLLWPVIFITCAIVIARKAPGKFFLHGFLVGFTNWVWVSAAHVLFFHTYAAGHAKEVAAMQALAVPNIPIIAQVVMAMRRYSLPIPGASGIVIGALSWAASFAIRAVSRWRD